MLSDKERKEIRRKIRQELEEKEQRRLRAKQQASKEKQKIAFHPEMEGEEAETVYKPNKYERAVSAQDSGEERKAHMKHSAEDWLHITKLKEEVEEDFYDSHNEYLQYFDRHGHKKWQHRKLFDEKQQKARNRIEVRKAKKSAFRRNLALFVSSVSFVVVAFIYFTMNRPYSYLWVSSNVDGAAIFIDNELTKHNTDALLASLSPGEHKVALYKPGYCTRFTTVELLKNDTSQVNIDLEIDSLFFHPKKTREPMKDELFPPAWSGKSSGRTPSASKRALASSSDKTSVLITSNISDAQIIIDGNPTPFEINQPITKLTPGTHIIEVQKQGYRSDPAYNVVKLTRGSSTRYLTFELIKESPLVLTVSTEPVDADIFVNSILMGHGEMVQEYQTPGRLKISFGEVRSFKTPPPIEAQLSERNPTINEKGVYLPLIELSVSLGQDGLVVEKGVSHVYSGYYFPNTGPVPSGENGPEIKKLEYHNVYAWEMGYAFARRNPPGSDYLQVIFSLPENFSKNKVLFLTLRGCASNRNYLLNLTKTTDIAIEVNGREILSHFSPTANIDWQEPMGKDSWPISDFLKVGENNVIIRTTAENKCYYYLNAIEIN